MPDPANNDPQKAGRDPGRNDAPTPDPVPAFPPLNPQQLPHPPHSSPPPPANPAHAQIPADLQNLQPFRPGPPPSSPFRPAPSPAAEHHPPAKEPHTPRGPAASPASDFSNEVREIMGRTPHWLIRWGMTVIGVTLAVVLALSWIIKYPDTITARIIITGLDPAVGVVARKDGPIEKLFVQENQLVAKDELLALIDSPANHERVFRLKDEIEKLRPFLHDESEFTSLDLGTESELGSLQASYSKFHSDFLLYKTTLDDAYIEKTVASLASQAENKQAQIAAMLQQADAALREVELAEQKYERFKRLHQRQSVSTAELQEQEAALLSQQRDNSEVRKALIDEEIALTGYQKQISELRHQRGLKLRETRTNLRESLKKLFSDIEIWEADYVLRAPTSGKVAFYEFWTDQQQVQNGKEVFVIVPDESPLMGRAQITKGGGKIKPGQVVRIQCDDFPYKEYGVVTGHVANLSLVPRNGAYLVSVQLDYPLTSSYGKEITFKQDMGGQASIVTDDRRLIGRIFNEFRKVFINTTSST